MLRHAMFMIVVVGRCRSLTTSLVISTTINGLLGLMPSEWYFGGSSRGESVSNLEDGPDPWMPPPAATLDDASSSSR